MVEIGKYDLVMKICRENLFMTTEGSKGTYDMAKSLLYTTDNFRDQVMTHLFTQQMQGNNKMTESLINECTKQQDM